MQEKLSQIKPLLNSGNLYAGIDEELLAYQHELVERLNQFNNTPDTSEGLKSGKKSYEKLLAHMEKTYILFRRSMQTGGLKMSTLERMLFLTLMCALWMMPIFSSAMTA